jgi:hypothetical protein
MKGDGIQFHVALFDSPVKPYTITSDNRDQEEMCMQDPMFIRWLTGSQQEERRAGQINEKLKLLVWCLFPVAWAALFIMEN